MENKVEKFAVAMIVNNRFGVLNRIAGLYAKRCYNIDNISAGTLDDPNYTRITIVSTGDEYMKDQVVRQLEKLIDVRAVTLLEPEKHRICPAYVHQNAPDWKPQRFQQTSGTGSDQRVRRKSRRLR